MLRYRIISGWSMLVVWLAKAILGIRWQVEGREHLPSRPAVILAKHQSAWETMAFQLIFPPQVHVLKRELLWIPFFGWGLALMSPIAIDRSRGVAALRAIARRGRERLEQGFWVVVFPEGTRVRPGERRPYQLGGAWLAAEAGAPVVELHTGTYADAPGPHKQDEELHRLAQAAVQAARLGLEVHAGHGLHYHNVGAVAAIRDVVELNIGHAIIARAIMTGLATAVTDMKKLMREARP